MKGISIHNCTVHVKTFETTAPGNGGKGIAIQHIYLSIGWYEYSIIYIVICSYNSMSIDMQKQVLPAHPVI